MIIIKIKHLLKMSGVIIIKIGFQRIIIPDFFTLPYRLWSSIVIVHEKKYFFASFFSKISKTAETILIKKLSETMAFWSTKRP